MRNLAGSNPKAVIAKKSGTADHGSAVYLTDRPNATVQLHTPDCHTGGTPRHSARILQMHIDATIGGIERHGVCTGDEERECRCGLSRNGSSHGSRGRHCRIDAGSGSRVGLTRRDADWQTDTTGIGTHVTASLLPTLTEATAKTPVLDRVTMPSAVGVTNTATISGTGSLDGDNSRVCSPTIRSAGPELAQSQASATSVGKIYAVGVKAKT